MAKVTVLAAIRSPSNKKLQLKGAFSQKKKLWEALEPMIPQPGNCKILDDVTGKTYDCNYNCLCGRLRTVGRASILDSQGQRQFFIIETNMNDVRDWDTGEDGNARLNPARGSEDEKES
jgi:hypothetical protein